MTKHDLPPVCMKSDKQRTAERANRQYFRRAYGTGRHGWSAEEPSPYVLEFLGKLRLLVPGGMLLDVGCGEGRHAIAAAKAGFKVTAVDYEPLALERARKLAVKKGAGSILFLEADVFRLPFSQPQFDIVLDYGCLHHQKKSTQTAYRNSILHVIKEKGFYILSVFSPAFHMFEGAHRQWHIAQGAYRRFFTPKDIDELFEKTFDILELHEEKGNGRGFWHVLMRRRK